MSQRGKATGTTARHSHTAQLGREGKNEKIKKVTALFAGYANEHDVMCNRTALNGVQRRSMG